MKASRATLRCQAVCDGIEGDARELAPKFNKRAHEDLVDANLLAKAGTVVGDDAQKP